MSDKYLRKEVKKLKIYQNISYKEIAELLEIRNSSFYAWLYGQYDFSNERKALLYDIISNLYIAEE